MSTHVVRIACFIPSGTVCLTLSLSDVVMCINVQRNFELNSNAPHSLSSPLLAHTRETNHKSKKRKRYALRIYRKKNAVFHSAKNSYNTHVSNTPRSLWPKDRRQTSALSRKDFDDAVSARTDHEPSVTAPANVTHAFAPHSAM